MHRKAEPAESATPAPPAATPPSYYAEIASSAASNLEVVAGLLHDSERATEGVFKAIKAKELSVEVRTLPSTCPPLVLRVLCVLHALGVLYVP
jgi:hypothetical protein